MNKQFPIPLLPSFDLWKPANPDRAVAVLMSGGVDSTVTARLLLDEGREIVGVTMRIPQTRNTGPQRPCCSEDAARVCRQLGIPHYTADTTAAFCELVIEPFRKAYAGGETPSPCINCNTTLKFGAVRRAIQRELGINNIATGHYARIAQEAAGDWRLGSATDGSRDQSYFLYGIRREDLPHTLFPLAQLSKNAVRERARELGLSSAERPDSMELCFAGEEDYRSVLGIAGATSAKCGGDAAPAASAGATKPSKEERRRARTIAINEATAGPILNEEGEVLGRHNGIWNFTPGQRKGIGIAAKEPLYVLRLDAARNAVIVGPRNRAFTDHITAGQVNILYPAELQTGALLFGRIRNTGTPAPCRIERVCEATATMQVHFDTPLFAPATGQHLVLYNAEGQISAGGVILPVSTLHLS